MSHSNSHRSLPITIAARSELVSGGECIAFETPDGSRKIYCEIGLNRTPVQSASLLKLRWAVGQEIDLLGPGDILRASIRFDENGDASLSYFDPVGRLEWTAAIRAEHAIPDTPQRVPERKRWYRWIAVAFTLFLFILTSFILITATAGPAFVAKAGVIFVVVVVASIYALQLLRGKHNL